VIETREIPVIAGTSGRRGRGRRSGAGPDTGLVPGRSAQCQLPANEVAAPMVSVALGAAVLHEQIPTSLAAMTAYLAATAALVAGTTWLARA